MMRMVEDISCVLAKAVPLQNFVCYSLNKIVDHKDPLTTQNCGRRNWTLVEGTG